MTRKQFFRQKITRNKAQLLGLLCQLKQLGLVYHIDDDPTDTVYYSGGKHCRTFTDAESKWLARFVRTLDRAFKKDVPECDRHCINSGAWLATDLAGFYRDVSDEQAALRSPVRVIVEVAGGVAQCVHSSHRISFDVLDHDNAGEDLSEEDEAESCKLCEEIRSLPYTQ